VPDSIGLSQRLVGLSSSLTGPERSNLKLLLGMAAGGLIRDGEAPDTGVAATAFDTTTTCIAGLQPHRLDMPENGVVYQGRPAFMTDDLLASLNAESLNVRDQAMRFDDHYVTTGAPLARQVALSDQLSTLVGERVAHIRPTAKANYLYYDEPGLGIEPHVDNEGFSLNAIMMLAHESTSKRSALVLYPPQLPAEHVQLAPGEMIIFFADSIAHARERVTDGEKIRIVAFGFQPVGAALSAATPEGDRS
jgi:hypothetical protein